MILQVQPANNLLGQLFGPNNAGANNQREEGANQNGAQPAPRRDDFLAFAGNLLGQAREVVNDPRAQAIAVVAAENQELAALLIRIGVAGNADIHRMNRNDLDLIVNNLDLLQRSGLLNAVRADINDPRFDAFLRLRERNPQVADSLAQFVVRAVTTENFGINDITSDDVLLIANNIDLMRETGLLQAIENDLPEEARQALHFRDRNPLLCRGVVALGERFPWLIDRGLGVGRFIASPPVQRFIEGVSSTVSNVGTFCGNVVTGAGELIQSAGRLAGNVIDRIRFW